MSMNEWVGRWRVGREWRVKNEEKKGLSEVAIEKVIVRQIDEKKREKENKESEHFET